MNRRKLSHDWMLSADQTDTGKMGVRIKCEGNIYPMHLRHYLTITRQQISEYVKPTPPGESIMATESVDEILEQALVRMACYDSMSDLYAQDNGDIDDYHDMQIVLNRLVHNREKASRQLYEATMLILDTTMKPSAEREELARRYSAFYGITETKQEQK